VNTPVGGIARYAGDNYQKSGADSRDVPGNPWFICTLWLAQWHIAKAERQEDLSKALSILEWVASRALLSGVLAEQIDPYTNEPLSVSPLTWSHATFAATVFEYLDKARVLGLMSVSQWTGGEER
jgi:glucoamylase